MCMLHRVYLMESTSGCSTLQSSRHWGKCLFSSHSCILFRDRDWLFCPLCCERFNSENNQRMLHRAQPHEYQFCRFKACLNPTFLKDFDSFKEVYKRKRIINEGKWHSFAFCWSKKPLVRCESCTATLSCLVRSWLGWAEADEPSCRVHRTTRKLHSLEVTILKQTHQ